jgi:hypothetical protein
VAHLRWAAANEGEGQVRRDEANARESVVIPRKYFLDEAVSSLFLICLSLLSPSSFPFYLPPSPNSIASCSHIPLRASQTNHHSSNSNHDYLSRPAQGHRHCTSPHHSLPLQTSRAARARYRPHRNLTLGHRSNIASPKTLVHCDCNLLVELALVPSSLTSPSFPFPIDTENSLTDRLAFVTYRLSCRILVITSLLFSPMVHC